MSTIEIERKHQLGKEEAQKAATGIAEELGRKFEVRHEWSGDRLKFHRQGVKGYLDVNEDRIRVKVELGLMLRPFKGKFEEEISRQLDKIIATG